MAHPFVDQRGLGRPLVGTERALYSFSRRSPLNLVVLARLDGPALDDLLPQALAAVQARHPLLRARIAGRPSRPRFDVGPVHASAGDPAAGPGPIPLRLARSQDEESLQAVVEAEMRTPFDPDHGPLARLTCVSGSGSASDLVLTLHHAIADGASAANLVHELLDWCRARLTGDAAPPAVPAAMPEPLTAVLPASLRGLRRWPKALALVLRQGGEEVAYRLGSRGRRPIPPPGRAATRPLRLSRDETASLVNRARRRRLTLTSLLSAALLWQASTVLYGGRPGAMRAIVWVDLRPHLSPPVPAETLGCYASMLRFVIRVDPQSGFCALAAQVQDRIERATRRGDRMPAALASAGLARIAARWPVARLGTTALSYAAAAAIDPCYGPINVRDVQGFVSNIRLGAELAASCGVASGSLWCNLLYLDSELDETTAAAVGDGLKSTLGGFARG